MRELEKETDLYLALLSFSAPASLKEIVEKIGPVQSSDYQKAVDDMVSEGYIDFKNGLFGFKQKDLSLKEVILDKLAGQNPGLELKELSPDKKERKRYQQELAKMKRAGLVKTVNRRWLIN